MSGAPDPHSPWSRLPRKAVALVDVVLPKGAVATGNAFEKGEDSPYGRCLLRVSDTRTAPFEAGHQHYA